MVDRVLSRTGRGALQRARAVCARRRRRPGRGARAAAQPRASCARVVDGALVELAERARAATGTRAHDRGRRRSALRSNPTRARAWRTRSSSACARAAASCASRSRRARRSTLVDRDVCAHCGLELGELTPASLSWYSERGACERCDGLGQRLQFDAERVVPDPSLSLRARRDRGVGQRRRPLLPDDAGRAARGAAGRCRQAVRQARGRRARARAARGGKHELSQGVIAGLERRLHEARAPARRRRELRLSAARARAVHAARALRGVRWRALEPARARGAHRRREHPRAERARARAACGCGFEALRWPGEQAKIAEPIVREVGRALARADRSRRRLPRPRARERARSRAARPSAFAWPRTSARACAACCTCSTSRRPACTRATPSACLRTLRALRDRGNTLLVVEHDLDVIAAADHVIDLGPGAGERGGRVMASGTPARGRRDARRAHRAVSDRGAAASRRLARRAPAERFIRIRGARTHNLHGVDADVPLGRLTCVTGVSGSGKSSLVMHTLLPAAQAALRGEPLAVPAQIDGLAAIARVVHVAQTPIGRTPRSTPATYAGVFAAIRELFAELPDARMRGFGAERFSFNVKGGRCERCQGGGVVRVDMQFLPDVLRALRRVRRHALRARDAQPRYRGRSIADVLDATRRRSERALRAAAARRRSARQPARGRARLPAPRPERQPRCRPAKPSACAWRASSRGATTPPRCTRWTSPPRASTRARSSCSRKCSRAWSNAATRSW